VLNPVLNRGLRIIGRPAPESPLTLRTVLAAIGVNVLAWFANGLQIWVMATRLGAHGPHVLLACVGAYAFAWCVGFLIVIAPAGAGVRDVILVATLVPMLHGDHGAALAIALVSRLVTIVGDLAGAAAAGAIGMRAASRTAGGANAAASEPAAR
jgi:uncharacterized membrane protein YbhN (UPF0104 family)